MDERQQQQIFDEWLTQHKGLFFKVVRAYAFNPHDQDDLFQEVALQVWQSIPNFRGESKASTWIYRVALYAAMAWSRRERKHDRADQPLSGTELALVGNVDSADPRLNWLYEQIAQLSPIDRSVTLLMLDGYKYKEIADLLGISTSNVGVKISRIKQHLTQQSKQDRALRDAKTG